MDDSHPRGDSSPVLSWECYRQHLWNPSSGLCLEVALRQESSSGLLSQRDRRKAQPSGWKLTARGTQGPGSQLLLHSPFRRGVTCQKSHSRAGQSRARLGGLLGSGAESWLLPAAFVILHCLKLQSLHLKTRETKCTFLQVWSGLPRYSLGVSMVLDTQRLLWGLGPACPLDLCLFTC